MYTWNHQQVRFVTQAVLTGKTLNSCIAKFSGQCIGFWHCYMRSFAHWGELFEMHIVTAISTAPIGERNLQFAGLATEKFLMWLDWFPKANTSRAVANVQVGAILMETMMMRMAYHPKISNMISIILNGNESTLVTTSVRISTFRERQYERVYLTPDPWRKSNKSGAERWGALWNGTFQPFNRLTET